MAKTCIGLDIGSNSIKVVQLKEAKRGYALVNFGIEPIPTQTIVDGTIMNQAAVVDAIREIYGKLGIKQKECAIAIAGHSVIIKKINVPVMTPDELEEQIPWEAEHHIPFSKDDVEIDHQILNPNTAQGQMELLLVAAKKEVVGDYAAVAKEAQLAPVCIDVAAFAVQNAFEINYQPSASETVVIINVGAAISNINIIAGGVSAFTRDVTIGGNAFTEEIQKQLNVAYDEAEAYKIGGTGGEAAHEVVPQEVERILAQVAEVMAGEFQRSLDFYLATSADATISKIYLAGGSSKIPSLTRAIEERSRLPVELIDPFRKFAIDENRFDTGFLRAHAPEAAVAVGLALRREGDRA
jgi:type IV pilus assembly protein PilM